MRELEKAFGTWRLCDDYYDEITQDDLFEGLLGYGMFANKLPPIFTSHALYEYAVNKRWMPRKKSRGYVSFVALKNTGGVRSMGIPHPASYYRLCCALRDSWEIIKKEMSDNSDCQRYKVSRIHLRKSFTSKRLFDMSYRSWKLDGDPTPIIQIDKKYLAMSDISQCFPSIYTHAISWALVGKRSAKENKKDSSLWFNQLDEAERNCTNGETHGILIGPDASNLLAELILSKIDRNLVEQGYEFIRNVDDYKCYVRDEVRAEQFILDLDEALRRYGLMRNHGKTKIVKLPVAGEDGWVGILKRASSSLDGTLSRGDVAGALDLSVDLAEQYGNASILLYQMKVLDRHDFTVPAAEYYVARALQFVRIFPYLLPNMEELVFNKFDVNEKDIQKLVDEVWSDAFEKHEWYAAYYAFYYAIKYKLSIANLRVDDVIKTDDCILKLFEMCYARQHRNTSALKKLEENACELQEEDADSNWLFIYEVLKKRDIEDPDLRALKNAGVSFLSYC